MTKWEYKEFCCDDSSQDGPLKKLVDLGREGWELMSVESKGYYGGSYKTYLLKRPLEENKNDQSSQMG